MTNEEAIARIREHQVIHKHKEPRAIRITEAFDLAIKALEEIEKHKETFDWCTDCKEYDQEAHCCHRWTKQIRDTVDELKSQPAEGDLISRADAIEMAIEGADDWGGGCSNHRAEMITEYINRVPSVKPKKGKWIVISCEPTDIFKCSECGMRVINPYRYCHNCGAKMEVEDE